MACKNYYDTGSDQPYCGTCGMHHFEHVKHLLSEGNVADEKKFGQDYAEGQWQPGHKNTLTAQAQRKVETFKAPGNPEMFDMDVPSPAERFGQHVLEGGLAPADPFFDPERRFYDKDRDNPLMTREQLEKEAAERQERLRELARAQRELIEALQAQTTPILKLPAREADALPNGLAAQAMRHPLGGGPTRATILPDDSKERKEYPIASGVLDYFPDAIAYLARLSYLANEQHNPGQPVHWARGKSTDHADTLARHFVQRGTIDKDRIRHTGKVAWRALAMLQEELENAQAEKGEEAA